MFRSGRYIGPWYQQDQGNGESGGGNTTAEQNQNQTQNQQDAKKSDDVLGDLTPEQQAEINRRMAAARKDGEKDGKTKAQADADKVKADAEVEAKRLADIAKGDFDAVKASLEGERDTLKSERDGLVEERDALKARVEAYEQRDTQRLESALKDLPEDLKATDPINFDPDVSLDARLKWLDVQQAAAGKRTTDPVKGNGRNPAGVNGHDPKGDEKARAAFAQRYQ